MCWSKEVSLGLGLCGVAMTLDQLRRWKNGQHKSLSVVFVYFLYSFMELFQFTQYMVGFEKCDQKNEFMTLIAHILIWIQPIFLNFHSFMYTKENKALFRFTLFGSIAAALTSSYALYLGYFAAKSGTYVVTNERIHNLGAELCTKATDIHFSWFFPYDSLDGYRPMGFVWILLAGFPHLFRTDGYSMDDWFASGPLYGSLGVIAGWLITRLIVGDFYHAHWSFWCLHSVSYAFLPYLWRIFVHPYFGHLFENKKKNE